MRRDTPPSSTRPSLWPPLIFLVGFAVLLAIISHAYLLPAFESVRATAPTSHKDHETWVLMIRSVKAWWTLCLAVMLVILISGLMLTFRVGRYFFPRPTSPRVRTKHVDAWAESGKRLDIDKSRDL